MDMTSFLIGYKSKAANVTPELQEKTVTPGTSAIEVMPDDGYDGLSKVIVEAVASGGSSAKFASGTLTPSQRWETVTHNLGCVPDVFIIVADTTITNMNMCLLMAYGFSTALKEKFGITTNSGNGALLKMFAANYPASPYNQVSGYRYGIENTGGTHLDSATETTIRVCYAAVSLDTATTYHWFAIGGIA